MIKAIQKTFLGIMILGAVIMVVYFIYKTDTKSYSPEDTVTYAHNDLHLEVFYNRPYKKERIIFGELVPYGEVWRTGANEATTFFTSKDILVDGSPLPAGKYTLWTIPGPESWKVIFNEKMYPWGITAEGTPYRDPQYDVLTVEVPVKKLEESQEQFTISFKEAYDFIEMNLFWDQTLVRIPIKDAATLEQISLN